MPDYDKAAYGDQLAGHYDGVFSRGVDRDVNAACDVLIPMAAGRPALELGVGTGLYALPLAARGLNVTGMDISKAMLDQLRAKAGSDRVKLVLGDMSAFKLDSKFALSILMSSSLDLLRTQEEQLNCFKCVSEHLEPGGKFVLDHLSKPSYGEKPLMFSPPEVTSLLFSRYDSVAQKIYASQVVIDAGGTHVTKLELRFIYHSEMDLMAQLTGLRLVNRWGGWRQEPFTDLSTRHVSVYEKIA